MQQQRATAGGLKPLQCDVLGGVSLVHQPLCIAVRLVGCVLLVQSLACAAP